VCGEDVGDCIDALLILIAEVVVDDKVELGEKPDVSPPLEEDGCPHGGLGREEGDDDVKHLVREAADEVKGRRGLFQISLVMATQETQ
jgi:hypothetical protein